MRDNSKNKSRLNATLSRRQFLKGGVAASAVGLSLVGTPGCTYKGVLEDDYPLVPENRVRLPANGSSVLILGGGFASMHAACELVDRGFDVTVIEKANTLGGKLKSWRDKEFGVPPKSNANWMGYSRDAGMHAVWGCYNNLREFMGRHDYELYPFPFEDTTMYYFLDKDGAEATMLHPLPTWPGMLRDIERYLNMTAAMEDISGEDVGLASYLLKMMSFDFQDPDQRGYLDSISFPDWARSVGVPEAVIYRIFGSFADMAAFDHIDNVSALHILTMMHLLFGSLNDMRIDLFAHPVGETYVANLAEYIESRGGRIVYDTPVTRLNYESGKIKSVTAGSGIGAATDGVWRCNVCGEELRSPTKPGICPICGASADQIVPLTSASVREFTADYYVVGMDTPGAQGLVSQSELPDDSRYFEKMMRLGKTSVLVVDMWFSDCDAWIKRFPQHWNFMPSGFDHLGMTLNWAMAEVNGKKVPEPYVAEYQPSHVGDNIAVIETQIASTDSVSGVADKEIVKRVQRELKILMPDLPEPTDFYINRWDTYSIYRVGDQSNRPTIESPMENLFFIGDWVETNHQSVYMEKAMVSAKMVTNVLLNRTGQSEGKITILQSGTPNKIIETCRTLFSVYPETETRRASL